MQRLEDILESDIDYIFTQYRDFTRVTCVQIGAEKFSLYTSLQSISSEFSASEKPVNAYNAELLLRAKDITPTAKKTLKKDAIIYVDDTAYRVIDIDVSRGVIAMSLERKGGR
jgi:hypothetical protein